MRFEPHEFRDAVFLCKRGHFLLFVFGNAAREMVRNPGLQDARLPGEDIDIKGSVRPSAHRVVLGGEYA